MSGCLGRHRPLRLIVQRANGNPARIDQICAAALDSAEGRGVAVVDTAAVESIGNGATSTDDSGASVANKEPETPTYFFNEDDEDPRAAYAIYDTDAGKVYINRIAYDIPREMRRIRDAGLPEMLAARLEWGV